MRDSTHPPTGGITIRQFTSLAVFLALSLIANAQTAVTYSGAAAAVRADVLGIINASISDTGPLPSSGGPLSVTLFDFQLPPTLSLNLLSGSTSQAGVSCPGGPLISPE